jgi:O-antigen ligase
MVASDRNSRTILAKVTVPMAEEAGAWGSGPGSYKVLFPHSRHMRPELYANFIVTEYVPGGRISMWSNAHNDYLQTVIEWGWVGGIAWGVLLFAGLARLLLPVFLLRPGQAETPGRVFTDDTLFRFSAGLALLGMCLHALVDFPFQVASLQLYASVLLGIAWRHRAEIPEPTGKSHIISRLLMIL